MMRDKAKRAVCSRLKGEKMCHSRHWNEAKFGDSYQILDRFGRRSSRIKLVEKRDFRRAAPYRIRKGKKRMVNHAKMGLPMQRGAVEIGGSWARFEGMLKEFKHVEEMLRHLKYNTDPKLLDSMAPLDAALEYIMAQSRLRSHPASKEFRNLLLVRSADFFERAEAHEIDGKMSPRAHYRALTTYWMYIMLESILQDTNAVASSSAAYAYSFLYPYTDDIMDMVDNIPAGAELISVTQIKRELVANISQKLKTGNHPRSFALRGSTTGLERECRIYELIDEVLLSVGSGGDTTINPGLRDSMLSINSAQLASVKQQRDFDNMSEGVRSMSRTEKFEIFDITVNKGSASVLPLAYINHPNLTKEQAELAATMGYFGQFINDIEGLDDDLANRSVTPALLTYLKHGYLDRYVERCLIHIDSLTRRISVQFPSLPPDRINMLLGLFRLRLLATTALCHQQRCRRRQEDCLLPNPVLSPSFVKKLEQTINVPLPALACMAQLEQEAFGGGGRRQSGEDDGEFEQCATRQQISSPERLRAFIICKVEEWLGATL